MLQMPVYTGGDNTVYMQLLQIYGNQRGQDSENQYIHDKYLADCKNYLVQYNSQLAHNLALPIPPVMPQKKNYNDDGTISYIPFGDLTQIQPPVAASNVGVGSIAASNPPMDRTDAILMVVNANHQLLLDIQGKLNK